MSKKTTHSAARRNEWLGIIYVGGEVVTALAAPGEDDDDVIKASVNLLLRPVFDSHYESPWPNAGPVPYTSVYATTLDDAPLNIEMATWPGERTTVSLTAESPAQRRVRLASSLLVQ